MSFKLTGQLVILLVGLLKSVKRLRFDPEKQYRRILITHHLLLGDTILLTPLLAKLRQRYPEAEIRMTVSPPFVPLYINQPYGVNVQPYHPQNFSSLLNCLKSGGYDLALVPGNIRYSWLARALGACCIIAFPEERPSWKSWQIDHLISWPNEPCTLADMFCRMVNGPEPPAFDTNQWPVSKQSLSVPAKPYCVLHISSRNILRRWPVTSWNTLANQLRSRGLEIVWSSGPSEDELLTKINIAPQDTQYLGTLTLPQLRQLLTGAKLLVTVETGIAHLCRLTGTPSVVIYGQGNPALHGNESFWQAASPMEPVFDENIQCRNQSHVFRRILPWVRRCDRGPESCTKPVCIDALPPERVIRAIDVLASRQRQEQGDNHLDTHRI